jgi:hypothetical protein
MNRIAINGSNRSGRSDLAKAFAAMTGLGIIAGTPYALIAAKYKLDIDKAKCQWPDSFVYCLGAFTQRIMLEQKLEDSYISDGGVFNEISWLKCRYPHIELIYERSMIRSLENIMAEYASNAYDLMFHIDSNDLSDSIDRCLKQLYLHHHLIHHIIDGTNREDALNQMLNYLQVKPLLSAEYSLLSAGSHL